eukprot:scaffold641_cov237-Pinguiococcus_pyrenoidosus.AAC.1
MEMNSILAAASVVFREHLLRRLEHVLHRKGHVAMDILATSRVIVQGPEEIKTPAPKRFLLPRARRRLKEDRSAAFRVRRELPALPTNYAWLHQEKEQNRILPYCCSPDGVALSRTAASKCESRPSAGERQKSAEATNHLLAPCCGCEAHLDALLRREPLHVVLNKPPARKKRSETPEAL